LYFPTNFTEKVKSLFQESKSDSLRLIEKIIPKIFCMNFKCHYGNSNFWGPANPQEKFELMKIQINEILNIENRLCNFFAHCTYLRTYTRSYFHAIGVLHKSTCVCIFILLRYACMSNIVCVAIHALNILYATIF